MRLPRAASRPARTDDVESFRVASSRIASGRSTPQSARARDAVGGARPPATTTRDAAARHAPRATRVSPPRFVLHCVTQHATARTTRAYRICADPRREARRAARERDEERAARVSRLSLSQRWEARVAVCAARSWRARRLGRDRSINRSIRRARRRLAARFERRRAVARAPRAGARGARDKQHGTSDAAAATRGPSLAGGGRSIHIPDWTGMTFGPCIVARVFWCPAA